MKKVSELRTRLRTGRLTFTHLPKPGQWSCGRWKSHHRKIVPLSLCWRTFKLKGNKKFRTWTKKSLLVFGVSGFLCSMYICYEHSMYVSHIHIMGMVHLDCFSQVNNHFEIWSLWWNKVGLFPNCGHVNTIVGCITLMKYQKKKFVRHFTRVLYVVLNKFKKQHPKRQQLYSHLSPISQTILVRWARYAEHY